jgi:pantoate--beta-alanine ligase
MTEPVGAIALIRERLAALRIVGPVGIVPTMGALHAGHARLLDRAREECRTVVATIFVNPLQFDRADDLDRYPRPLEADVAFCATHGVDFVFSPATHEIYPTTPLCTVDVGPLGDHLCGRFRPGHFRGVATVVLKLLLIVQPDIAYFGEKDAQQLAIIRRMVLDFNVPVTITGVPTVREADGLALSSRNIHLTPVERRLAPALYGALTEARDHIASGATNPKDVRAAALGRVPADAGVRLEYLEVVDPDDMQPVDRISGRVCVAGAMWVGNTRLIDNVCIP